MTVREQIAENIKSRLETIRPGLVIGSRTCETALKGAHLWRKVPLLPTDCPAVIVYDTSAEQQTDGVLGMDTYNLQLDIVGLVTQSAPMSAIRGLLADILAVIGSDYTHGGLCFHTVIRTQNIIREDAGDIVAAVELGLTISYEVEPWRI